MRWLLYIDSQLGSSPQCLAALKLSANIDLPIVEIDLAKLPSTERPQFINDVPSLLDRSNEVLYAKDQCIVHLRYLYQARGTQPVFIGTRFPICQKNIEVPIKTNYKHE